MSITKSNTRMLEGDVDLTTQITGVLPVANGGTGSSAGASSFPAGSVIYHAANTPPTGFLKADGAAVSRSTYSDLFASIGTTYGAGDGSTTFLVPDLRGEFMRGWDDSRGIDSGRSFGSSQADEFEAHSHNYTNPTNGSTPTGTGGGTNRSFPTTNGGTTTSTGGSETRPRNVALLACIKF
jgi:microcystin-dependent protein